MTEENYGFSSKASIDADSFELIRLPELQPNRLIRKIMRSKKLTRAFLGKGEMYSAHNIDHFFDPAKLKQTALIPEENKVLGDPTIYIGDLSAVLESAPHKRPHPAIRTFTIPEATVFSNSNLVQIGQAILHHGLIDMTTDRLPEEYQNGTFKHKEKNAMILPSRKNQQHQMPKAFSLLDATAKNYAHWLTEILPKAVTFYREDANKTIPFLIDEGLHANIMRSLELAVGTGIPGYIVPRGQHIRVNQLHYLSPTGHIPFEPRQKKAQGQSHGTFSTTAIRQTTEAIKRKLILNEDDPQDRLLYIKRNSGIRHIHNAAEVEAAALHAGFQIIEPEKMTFDEQVTAFHRAAVVVGATGAALASMIFARPACRVGILISSHPETPYYYWQRLGESVGLSIGYVVCQTRDERPPTVHCDFIAPTDRLYEFFERIKTDPRSGAELNSSHEAARQK